MVKNGAKRETVLIFIDEKLFHVDPKCTNIRNVRYIFDLPEREVDSTIKYNPRTKHAAKVMALGVVVYPRSLQFVLSRVESVIVADGGYIE